MCDRVGERERGNGGICGSREGSEAEILKKVPKLGQILNATPYNTMFMSIVARSVAVIQLKKSIIYKNIKIKKIKS